MPTPLHRRLEAIRHDVRRALWIFGVSWTVAVLLGAVLVVGGLDWLLHLNDPVVRAMLGVTILGTAGWVAWRFLIAPLLVPLSDLDLALHIESRYPALRDSLSSSVQFLASGSDRRLGSPQLQQAVVAQTLTRIEQLDVADLLDRRPIRRISLLAGGAAAALLLVAGLNQADAATALKRLMFPFAGHSWPRQTVLELVDAGLRPLESSAKDPLRIAEGGALEVFVRNARGRLPEDALLVYRFPDGELATESLQLTTLRDAQGHPQEVGVVHVSVPEGRVRFRAIGGDDQTMPWHALEVVPPPAIEQLQVTLHPPAYTQRAPETLPADAGHIEGLLGTRAELDVRVSKRLASAVLHVGDLAKPIELDKGGRRFTTALEIATAGVGSYWLELRDAEGFSSGDAIRYQLRGIADQVPEVAIEVPASDLLLTPDAQLDLRIAARDDLAVDQVALRFGPAGGELSADENPGQVVPLELAEFRPLQTSVTYAWDIAAMQWSPGTRIAFHAEATDFFDLGPPHVGQSATRVVTIVAPEEKASELGAHVSALLDDLEDAASAQERARQHVGELRTQLDRVRALRPQDVDLLKRVDLDQRQIGSRLRGATEGLEPAARQIAAEYQQNRINDPEVQGRLEQIVQELERIGGDHLPAIEQNLTFARKSAEPLSPAADGSTREDGSQSPTPPGDALPLAGEASEALGAAADHQAAVLEGLEQMLQLLSEWRNRRDVASDLAEIVAGQATLNQETAAVGRETLTRSLSELTTQQRADLERLADRQRQESERLEQLQRQLTDMSARIAEEDAGGNSALAEAAGTLTQQAVAAQMREAARQIASNSIGTATASQERVLQDLRALGEQLAGGESDDEGRLVRQQREAEQELDALRDQQRDLQEQAATSAAEALPALAGPQQALRDEVLRLKRRLERLQAPEAAEAATRAAERMGDAARALGQRAADGSRSNQQEAIDDLEQAQRALSAARRQAEQALAQERLATVADELKGMVARQQAVIDETLRLERERAARGNWSRALLGALRDLAEVQEGLQREVEGLAESLAAADVVALAVRGAAHHMQRASEQLKQRDTGSFTVDQEQAARQRIADLVATLEPEKPTPEDGTPSSEASPPSAAATGGVPPLGQLRILKTLQEDVMRRTAQLDAALAASAALSPLQEQERQDVAAEQGRLAELARQLLEQLAAGRDE